MIALTATDRTPDIRCDTSHDPAAHRHSRRCFWDLHQGRWHCPPPAREGTRGDATTSTRPPRATR